MKDKKKENVFLITWISCLLLLIGACNVGFLRGTRAGFGPNNMTGQLTVPCKITYQSNYPSETGKTNEQKTVTYICFETYTMNNETFNLNGYEIISWNTASDGSGISYPINEDYTLNNDITIYARWEKTEDITISYGDVNQNGQIDENDYLLIESHVSGVIELTGQSLLNADVNEDGNVDSVDADIVKQAYLGTEGYVDYLPSNPILIYEVYKGNSSNNPDDSENNETEDNKDNADDSEKEDINNNESTDSGSEDNSSDKPSSGSDSNNEGSTGNSSNGTGNGSSGNGSSSSGTGSGGNTSSSGGNGNGSGNSNKPSSSNSSSSENNQSNTPSKEDNKTESDNNNIEKDNPITRPEIDKDNLDNEEINNNTNKKSYVWIIVTAICLISFRLIIYVIKKFKENNSESE